MTLPSNVFAQAVSAEPNPNDINLPDIIPEDNEILSGYFTVYAWDVDFSAIYEKLKTTIVTTVTKEGVIKRVPLSDLREDNTKWGDWIYTKDIFPSTWSDSQIMNYYMWRNNTKWEWLPHDTSYSRTRKKFVALPESFSPEL